MIAKCDTIWIKPSQYILLGLLVGLILWSGVDSFSKCTVGFAIFTVLFAAFILFIFFNSSPISITVSETQFIGRWLTVKKKSVSFDNITSVTISTLLSRGFKTQSINIESDRSPASDNITISTIFPPEGYFQGGGRSRVKSTIGKL